MQCISNVLILYLPILSMNTQTVQGVYTPKIPVEVLNDFNSTANHKRGIKALEKIYGRPLTKGDLFWLYRVDV